MKQPVRRRFWIESAAAVVSFALLALTLVWDEWIELAFNVSPDGGDGELEWVLTGVALVATVVFVLLARVEWRRAATAAQPA